MTQTDTRTLPIAIRNQLDALLADFMANQYQPSRLLAFRRPGAGARWTLFYALGYLAKADGRVTENDIQYAENLIRGLGLSARARRKAIRRFQKGRDASHLSPPKLALYRLVSPWRQPTSLLIGLCLCHGAQLHGPPGKPRRYRCEDAFDRLGLPLATVDRIFRLYREHVWVGEPPPQPETLQDAYDILGVNARENFSEIKRAYRRKVSRYHPDKLGNDLSATEQARARDQLLRLQQAWEVVKRRDRLIR